MYDDNRAAVQKKDQQQLAGRARRRATGLEVAALGKMGAAGREGRTRKSGWELTLSAMRLFLSAGHKRVRWQGAGRMSWADSRARGSRGRGRVGVRWMDQARMGPPQSLCRGLEGSNNGGGINQDAWADRDAA